MRIWAQVDVQVVAALALALPPDPPHLRRLVDAQDRDAQLLPHQPANRVRDRIGRIDDDLRPVKRAALRDEVGVELLDVGAVAEEEMGAELLEARRRSLPGDRRARRCGRPSQVEAKPLNLGGIVHPSLSPSCSAAESGRRDGASASP